MKPILFVSGLGDSLERAENMSALYEAYKGPKEFRRAGERDFVNLVGSGLFDVMVIDVFPTVKPKKSIMIWHAIQGGKYIGLDEPKSYYQRGMESLIDYIVVPGFGGVEMFNRCTGVEKERILALGMPRTDRYIGKKKGDGCTFLADKKAYLYVPTFRNSREEPIWDIDWHAIDDRLNDDEIFVVKPHPYGKPFDIRGCKHIVQVNKMEPSVNYLYDCDVVITDYSSIMFDAYLLDIPAVLFEKERGYVENRGMYLKYPDQYSSWYCTNEQDLISAIRLADMYGMTRVERECIGYVADRCDGHSCERICQFINEVDRNG